MERTRDRAVYVTTALSLWGIALTVSNPWLVGWLGLSAVGALAFAVKPRWARFALGGKKGSEAPENENRRPRFDFENSDVEMTDTTTKGGGPHVRAKDSKFKSDKWREE